MVNNFSFDIWTKGFVLIQNFKIGFILVRGKGVFLVHANTILHIFE